MTYTRSEAFLRAHLDPPRHKFERPLYALILTTVLLYAFSLVSSAVWFSVNASVFLGVPFREGWSALADRRGTFLLFFAANCAISQMLAALVKAWLRGGDE